MPGCCRLTDPKDIAPEGRGEDPALAWALDAVVAAVGGDVLAEEVLQPRFFFAVTAGSGDEITDMLGMLRERGQVGFCVGMKRKMWRRGDGWRRGSRSRSES